MKKNMFLLAASMLLLTTVSCQNQKKSDEAAPADTTATVKLEEPTVKSVYDTDDAVFFGLKGEVKEVVTTFYEATPNGNKLVRGKKNTDAAEQHVTFNELGYVTLDPYGNPYAYDENGKFVKGRTKTTKMVRDNRGLITVYDHQIQGDEHWNSYKYEFKHDDAGRIIEYTYTGWEEIFGYKFIYENEDDLWPIKQTMEGQACADLFESEILYRYLSFDEQGNWLERECWTVDKQGVDNGDDNPDMTSENSYSIERRTITYY